MSRIELSQLIEDIRSSNAPPGITTRVIAVDGPGGAGKSTLAEYIARELDAPIVHTDEFASWENPTDWWPELIEKVLAPLRAGRPARYTPTSWDGGDTEEVLVPPADFVVLEGVTASRAAFRAYLAYTIWIDTPRELRLRRGLDRDGEAARADWQRWMAAEDAYVERERPSERADFVVRGDEDLWL